MPLDENFYEDRWHKAIQIHAQERQLGRILAVVASICIVSWLIYTLFDNRSAEPFFLIGVALILTVLPISGGLLLNFLIAFIPYQRLSYRQRFFHHYLLLLNIVYFILLLILVIKVLDSVL